MKQLTMQTHIKIYQLLILAIFLICKTASAQFSVNLILGRTPSYLSDWSNPITGQLLVNYTAATATQIKLATKLQDLSGNTIGTSNIATAQVLTINPGTNVVRMDRVLQLENMQFTGLAKALAVSGKLPAGTYQLCVQLFTVDGNTITDPQCRIFNQLNYQLPFLLYPADKTWLDANTAQTAITFRWSSVVPATQEIFTYRLQVFEIQDGQTPMQALRSNQPILLTELRRVTQFIWQPQLSLKDSAIHRFIWTLQTFDSEGQPLTSPDASNQGRSEPRIFGICNKIPGSNAANCGEGYKW